MKRPSEVIHITELLKAGSTEQLFALFDEFKKMSFSHCSLFALVAQFELFVVRNVRTVRTVRTVRRLTKKVLFAVRWTLPIGRCQK